MQEASGKRREARGAQEVAVFRAHGGEIGRWPMEAANLDAVSAQLPPGAYTTLRTYAGRKVLRLDDHWARLRDSALRLDEQMCIALSRADLARVLGLALAQAGLDEARVRLTLSVPEGELFIALQPFEPFPAELFGQGAAVAVCPFVPHATEAKATASISPLRGAKATLPDWAHEGLMVNAAGFILEGLSSNFFAVKDGVLRTASENVIIGTTRTLVLDLAAQLLPVVFEPVRVSELDTVAECFITSVSREVLPVVRVGDQIIGAGKPGRTTRELLRRFRDYVRVHAEAV